MGAGGFSGVHLAAAVAAVALMLAGPSGSQPEQGRPQPESSQPKEDNRGQGRPGNQGVAAQPVAPAPGTPSTEQAEPTTNEGAAKDAAEKAERDDKRSDADLAAQEIMADSAVLMAIFTALQAVIGIGALVGLFLTLKYTRQALKLAEASAKATIDAAGAAVESVRIARNATRPYFSVQFGNLGRSTDSEDKEGETIVLAVGFFIANLGGTVAFVDAWAAGVEITSPGMAPSGRSLVVRNKFGIAIQPREQFKYANWQFRISLSDRRRIQSGGAQGFLAGYLRYRDLHRVVWRTNFVFEYVVAENGTDTVVALSDHPQWNDHEETEEERAQHEAAPRQP